MNKDIKVSSVILAAGLSSRMGELKALLNIGGKEAIIHLIDENIKAGIQDIVVVLGYKNEEIKKHIEKFNVKCVINENYSMGMYSSVQVGVKAISKDSRAFMIMPVDIPLIKSNTIMELCEFFEGNNYDIISPFFINTPGHPPVISVRCIESILKNEPSGGLNDIICSKERTRYRFNSIDEGILYEMDTKEQYYKLLNYYETSYTPNELECSEILNRCEVSEHIINHMKMVSKAALRIGNALNFSGGNLDLKLIYSAAMLHDIKRCEKNHPLRAKEFLNNIGYESLSDIVGEHMDIEVTKNNFLCEKEVLYLADKYVKSHAFVPLNIRFEDALKNCDSRIIKNVKLRYKNALKIEEKVEFITGKNPYEIILDEKWDNCG
ncbi:MAG: DVU_1551 family NTP transferase [Solirubrobacterales bacterium]